MFQDIFPTANIEIYRVFVQPDDEITPIQENEGLLVPFDDPFDDFSFDGDTLEMNLHNFEMVWNDENFETLSLPPDFDSIYDPISHDMKVLKICKKFLKNNINLRRYGCHHPLILNSMKMTMI